MEKYRIDRRSSSTHYLFTTVRIECSYADGAIGSGTAFFFGDGDPSVKEIPYLVTNNHVIEGAVQLRIQFHVDPSPEPWNFTVNEERWITIENPSELWIPHPDPAIDLCAVPVQVLKDKYPALEDIFFTWISSSSIPKPEEEKSYHALMNIAMIGYPMGLWDERNNLPIFRRGTTASHTGIDFDGKPEVVVDMACFPGSSGSPVVFHDLQYFASAVRFLGVLYAGPTYTLAGDVSLRLIPTCSDHSGVETMIHLGYVIKARKVLELTQFIQAKETKNA